MPHKIDTARIEKRLRKLPLDDFLKISVRELLMLEMRHGLSWVPTFVQPFTLVQVGEFFGFSRERARQVVFRAYAKLGVLDFQQKEK